MVNPTNRFPSSALATPLGPISYPGHAPAEKHSRTSQVSATARHCRAANRCLVVVGRRQQPRLVNGLGDGRQPIAGAHMRPGSALAAGGAAAPPCSRGRSRGGRRPSGPVAGVSVTDYDDAIVASEQQRIVERQSDQGHHSARWPAVDQQRRQ